MKMLTLLGVFIFSISAHAINGRTTYQARIVKPDGYPLEASSVNFRFTVLDPTGSCVMYVEDYGAVNMTSSGGLISFALGTGTVSFPASSTATTFSTTFDNAVTSFSCQSPGIYNPTPTDNRKIVMQFNDGNGWQTLPSMAINAVPYAMYAAKSQDSQKLNGKADTAFVQKASDIPTCAAGKMLYFNNASFSCVDVPAVGTSINSVSASGSALSITGTASDPVVTMSAASMSQDGYLTSLDYAEFKAKLAASSTQIVNTLGYAPVSGAAVTAQINNSNLSGDVSGTITSNFIQTVGGKTAAQISTSVDDTLAATASNTASTIVKRNSSGNATFNDVYANSTKINYVDIYKPSSSFNIRLQASTSLSANYTLTLPTTSGTTGQVLSTDGSGNLSWIDASTGSVVSVSATAPLASTGGSTPTISITQATSSTDGYLSSVDWNTFNNKQAATSVAIIATLGYTPADNAASGTYVKKAGDTLTGVLNLPSNGLTVGSSQLVVSGANIGIGTTTPVTKLDVSGGVRIGAESTTCAAALAGTLRYSGSNVEYCNGTSWQAFGVSGAGLQSLNGSTSGTQTFANGTAGTVPAFNTSNGVHTLNIPLASAGSVTAGLISNTDYTTFANKITSSAASIAQVLGYVPANDAASGTYAQKANNLSDLTNIATARTNLGLGTFATASAIDLGSASATGTLAIARLPSFIGDATIATASNTIILSNSGVTAGTYTKVSVDAKGRVTSSSALSSSDVTTALGYTPANSTSGVTSLNGSTSQTQTFATSDTGTAFGISTENGVHTFAIPQAASSSVTAGLLSNADYTTFTNKQNATSSAIIATLGYTPANATSATQWTTNGSSIYYNTGNIGVGIVNPSAKLELASGTASIAPLKLTSGTLLSSAQSGTMEYDGFNFYLTDSTNTRRAIATGSNANTIDNVSTINSSGNISMVPVGAVIVSSTTASTNSNTGALVVKGGLGVAGNINTAGNLNVSGSQVIDGSLKLTSMTSGSVLFAGASGTVTQDNSNFFWDGANKRLGIGSNSPAQTLSVSGTGYFSGNVGIGTSDPAALLEIGENTVSSSAFRFVPSSNQSSLRFTTNSVANWIQSGVDFSSGSRKDLRFSSINGASTWMTITGSGNVGIGTTTPDKQLTMHSTGLDNYIHLTSSMTGTTALDGVMIGTGSAGDAAIYNRENTNMLFLTNNTERVRIDNTGNVGIGTSAPVTTLHVVSKQSAAAVHPDRAGFVLEAEGTSVGGRIAAKVYSDTENPLFVAYRARGTKANPQPLLSGDLITAISPVGFDGSNWQTGAHVRFHTTENWNGSAIGSAISFRTVTNGTSTTLDRMRIDHNGNVGIGTKNPAAKLEITEENNTNYERGLISAQYNNGAQAPLIITKKARGTIDTPAAVLNGDYIFGLQAEAYTSGASFSLTKNILLARTAEDWTNAAQGYSLHFFTGAISSTATTEKMTITPSGNVGIGTVAPTVNNLSGTVLHINNNSSKAAVMHFTNSGTSTTAADGFVVGKWEDGQYSDGPIIWNYEATPITFATSSTERMVLSSTGNLGIGTSAPMSLLHLSQNSAQLRVETSSTSTTGNAPIYLVNQDTTANNVLGIYFATRDNGLEPDNGAIIRSVFTNRSASGVTADLAFLTANDAENPIERMRLNSSGYLGIGLTDPADTLSVSGTGLRVTRTSTFGGVATFSKTFTATNNEDTFIQIMHQPTSSGSLERYGYIQAGSNLGGMMLQAQNGGSGYSSLVLNRLGGNVGIGTTSPSYKLDVSGTINIASGSALAFGGTSVCTAAGCTSSSDERLKENIKPLDFDLNKLLSLNAVQYDWKNKAKYGDKHQIGFIAQNLEKVYPEVVYTDQNTGLKSVTYGHLVAPIIEALKSIYNRLLGLETRIDRQIASIVESKADKAEIEVLKQKAASLEVKAAKVDKLEAENEAKAKEINALKAYLCSKDPAASICK